MGTGGQDPKEPKLHLHHPLELEELGPSEWTAMSTNQSLAYGDLEVPPTHPHTTSVLGPGLRSAE